jgi:cytoskeletal protein RodZ
MNVFVSEREGREVNKNRAAKKGTIRETINFAPSCALISAHAGLGTNIQANVPGPLSRDLPHSAMIPLIGQELRSRREQMNLTLRDVSHRTRIPAAALRCLEEADYAIVGGSVYACSFLRSYNRCLGVNAQLSIEMLQTDAPARRAAGIHGGEMPYDIWGVKPTTTPSGYAESPLAAAGLLLILLLGSSGFWMSQPASSMAKKHEPKAPPIVRDTRSRPLRGLSYNQVSTSYSSERESQ